MTSKPSRRTMLKTAGVAALGMPAAYRAPISTPGGPRFEGKDTPKICLDAGPAAGPANDEAAAAARRIRQLGVEYVIFGGGPIPWEESRLTDMMDRLK